MQSQAALCNAQPAQPSPFLACSSSTAWLSPISAMRRMFSAMRFCAWVHRHQARVNIRQVGGPAAGRRAGCLIRHRERLMRAGRRSCWAHLALQLQLGRLGCHGGGRAAPQHSLRGSQVHQQTRVSGFAAGGGRWRGGSVAGALAGRHRSCPRRKAAVSMRSAGRAGLGKQQLEPPPACGLQASQSVLAPCVSACAARTHSRSAVAGAEGALRARTTEGWLEHRLAGRPMACAIARRQP